MADIVDTLRRQGRVGIDTSPFIYNLEGSLKFSAVSGRVFDALAAGEFHGVTSVITLMELTAGPLQLDQIDTADEYELLLRNYPNLTMVHIGIATARRAAEIRARYRLLPADALQIAACVEGQATAFLTNDGRFRRVAEIEVLVLEDFL